MSSLTIEEVRGAKEIVPGQEYWIRPGVHLVLERNGGGQAVCSNCISMKGIAGVVGSPCLVVENTRFKTCLQRSAYHWKIKPVSEPPAVSSPVQPSLF